MNKSKIKKVGQEVIKIESIALAKLSKSLDKDFIKAVELISKQNGKIIVSGVGKSGNIAGKIAASFTSTGIPAIYLNPVDASHGDMGIVEKNDVLIILSNSGESHELADLINFSKKKKIKIISITSSKKSLLSKNSDIGLVLPPHLEADKFGCKILQTPNVFNFTEIYKFLKINNNSLKIYDQKTLSNALLKLFPRNNSSTNIKKRINNIGQKVLTKTYNEIFSTFRNEI